jgi:hypothetical protein
LIQYPIGKTVVSFTIPDSVTTIGVYAFSGCSGLTGALTIGNSVTTIGVYAFSGCSGLTAINVDTANTAYSSIDGVLYNKAKTELIQYPIGKTVVSFTIPDSVTTIGYQAFYGCSGLTSVTFKGTITSDGLDAYAFSSLGDLRDKYLAGGIGTYTRPSGYSSIWTKMP